MGIVEIDHGVELGVGVELAHGVAQVVLHRVGRQVEAPGDLLRAEPLGRELEHLDLTVRQLAPVDLLEAAEVDQVPEDVAGEVGVVVGRGPHRRHQVGPVGVLRHEAGAAGVEGLGQHPAVGGRGDHHHPGAALELAELAGGVGPGAVGQAVVDQGHVGLVPAPGGQAGLHRAGGGHHLDPPVVAQQRGQALGHHLVVVDDQHPDRAPAARVAADVARAGVVVRVGGGIRRRRGHRRIVAQRPHRPRVSRRWWPGRRRPGGSRPGRTGWRRRAPRRGRRSGRWRWR